MGCSVRLEGKLERWSKKLEGKKIQPFHFFALQSFCPQSGGGATATATETAAFPGTGRSCLLRLAENALQMSRPRRRRGARQSWQPMGTSAYPGELVAGMRRRVVQFVWWECGGFVGGGRAWPRAVCLLRLVHFRNGIRNTANGTRLLVCLLRLAQTGELPDGTRIPAPLAQAQKVSVFSIIQFVPPARIVIVGSLLLQ